MFSEECTTSDRESPTTSGTSCTTEELFSVEELSDTASLGEWFTGVFTDSTTLLSEDTRLLLGDSRLLIEDPEELPESELLEA